MQKNMKKVLSTLGAIAFVATAFGVTALNTETAKAENENLRIAGKTLIVSNNVNVSFYVPVEAGDKNDITVCVTEENGSSAMLSAASTNYEYEGNNYYEFIYKGVMAYEMDTNLYAYAQMGETKSETVKYSVLQYAYNKLGMANGQADDNLNNLLTAMLNYGSAAAEFEGNTVDFLNDYTYVSIQNATFDDGFSYGLFKKGETVSVMANAGHKLNDTNGVFTQNGEAITFTVPEECFIDSESFVVDEGITADQKIAEEIARIEINAPQTVEQNTTFTLPDTDVQYEDVVIEWNVDNATLSGNVVDFDTVGTATVTVSVSCEGGVTQTKSAQVIVTAPVPVEKSLAVFEFGANGNASHSDGNTTEIKSYTENSNGYTLSLTSLSKVYEKARDAKGNSCLKLGSSSVAGTFTFTAPENVTQVVIRVAKYKAKTTKVTVNGGTAQTISTSCDNGEYTTITIDVTSNKTVTFATVSGATRAMVNSIEFIGFAK